MDFGKYVYEQQKKNKESKGNKSKTKEVKFRPRVEQHDFMTKLRHAEEFLNKGNKVKLTLSFRGREMAHTEIGFDTIKRAVKDLDHMATPDNEPRLIGRNINVMMTPLPANRRHPKYTQDDEEIEEESPDRQEEADAEEDHEKEAVERES